jgi:hypothetical protein
MNNVPQKQLSANHMRVFSEPKPGREYSFQATALEGSAKFLVTGKSREFFAQFEKVEGGDYKFKFNGMDLYIDPSEVKNGFTYIGYTNHGGKRRKTNNNRKSRKNRTNKTRRSN